MRPKPNSAQRGVQVFNASELLWALGSLCVLHQRNFSSDMLSREFPPEPSESGNYYTESALLHAAKRLGFQAKRIGLHAKDCVNPPLPLLIQMPAAPAITAAGHATDPFEAASAEALPPRTCLAACTRAPSRP